MPVSSGPIPLPLRGWLRPMTAGAVAAASAVLLVPSSSVRAQEPLPPRSSPVGATTEPHPVPPMVTDLGVPKVARGDRSATAAQLGDDQARGAPLVAHLRQPLTHEFSMVGVTWDAGTAAEGTTVSVRSRSEDTWTAWTALDFDPEEGPAPAEDASVRDGTAPAWVGQATGVEVAVYSPDGSAPAHLVVGAIDPGTSTYDTTATSAPPAAPSAQPGPEAGTFPNLPHVVTRSEWGVDLSLGDRCWNPRIGEAFKMVFVHHTAGSNDYTRAEAAAVVRGVYAYHTQSRGWCDIGYNFLVDRYGNLYVGRRGGMRLPVRGSHAGDYNVNTTGIALMGKFTSQPATRPMKHSLVQLIAWRMGTAYHGAYHGPRVHGKRFHRISGHSDAMSTTCPGDQVYAWLPTLRERVATRLGNYESVIEARWIALGGGNSRLGGVHIGEQGENGGRHTTFQTGRMYSSGAELHTLYRGPILGKYRKVGETDGTLGYPRSNVRPTVGHTGLSADFDGGRIYNSAATGSVVLVHSAILKRYRAEGSAAGRLGFPIGPVHSTKTGSLARFQHGTISRDTGARKTVVSYS